MSIYTTEVRFICEQKAGLSESIGFKDVDSIIAQAWSLIFTTKTPFFDEEYRGVLCSKILKHYYTREIAAETVGLWQLWVNTKMEEIMPYYNKLYESAKLDFNPLNDVDIKRTYNKIGDTTKDDNGTREETGEETRKTDTTTSNDMSGYTNNLVDTSKNENTTSSGSGNNNSTETGKRTLTIDDDKTTSGTSTNTHYDLYSDTPQGSVSGLDNQNYLTNARKISDNGSTSGKENTDRTDTENTTNTIKNDYTNSEKGDRTETGKETSALSTGSNTNGASNTSENSNNTLNEKTSLNSKINTTEDYIETLIGKQGGATYSEMLVKFRETFLNIDMMIIGEFEDCFFGLW